MNIFGWVVLIIAAVVVANVVVLFIMYPGSRYDNKVDEIERKWRGQ